MPIIDGPWLAAAHDPGADLVEITWKRFTPSEVLRGALERLREQLGARTPTRWLCDHVHMKVLASEDIAWIVDEWLPPPCAAPVRVALVDSIDALGRRSVARLVDQLRRARPTLAVAVFHQRAAARAWVFETQVTVPDTGT